MLQRAFRGLADCIAPIRIVCASIVIAVAMMVGRSAAAHHSYAMFDPKQSVTLRGTLKEFQWTNPHCFIQVSVDTGPRSVEWSVQLAEPQSLYRHGWRPGTLKPGDRITVVIHPTKDGSHSGDYVSGTGPDGKALLGD